MIKKIESKKKLIVIICVIIGIIAIIKFIDTYYQKQETNETNYFNIITEEKEEDIEEKIIVYITGEVKNQGVIELEYGSRISDAIEKAGGTTETANLKNVNLAYQLEDGQKIYIPNINEPSIQNDIEIVDDAAEGIVIEENKESIININSATQEELQNLNGIGENLSKSIIQYREENGKFESIDDLLNVPGIGENKLNNIKEYIKIK